MLSESIFLSQRDNQARCTRESQFDILDNPNLRSIIRISHKPKGWRKSIYNWPHTHYAEAFAYRKVYSSFINIQRYLFLNNKNKLILSNELPELYTTQKEKLFKKLEKEVGLKLPSQIDNVQSSKQHSGIQIFRNIQNGNHGFQQETEQALSPLLKAQEIEKNKQVQININPANTQNNNNKAQQKTVSVQEAQENTKFLLIMKLGNNQASQQDLPFNIGNVFTLANSDGKIVLEINDTEDDTFQEKLSTKSAKFNYFSEDQPEQLVRKMIQQEWQFFLPQYEQCQKKFKFNQNPLDKDILDFIEREIKNQTESKANDTFLSTFVNLNPLKTQYFDPYGTEEANGSNFMFEVVQQYEIQEINELLTLLYPLISLTKHPIYLTIAKYQSSEVNKQSEIFSTPQQEYIANKDLHFYFAKLQKHAMAQILECTTVIQKLLLWLSDTPSHLAMENIVAEPMTSRQSLIREIGCIDYVIKLLYELHISGLLYMVNMQVDPVINGSFGASLKMHANANEDQTLKTELDGLIDSISAFLQIICKNSYENSLYTVQWYFLFKHILLKGNVNQALRLDLLLTQLFQQTDMNITFQYEVNTLLQETNFQKFNKHAYNLLIAFCLHTKYRKKEALAELVKCIFEDNRDTIFTKFHYDSMKQAIQIQIPGQLMYHNITRGNRLVMKSATPAQSPQTPFTSIEIPGTCFVSKQQLNDYMISCVRLVLFLNQSYYILVFRSLQILATPRVTSYLINLSI